jgi:hypothetical protein
MRVLRSRWGRAAYVGLVLAGLGALAWGLFGTSTQIHNRINDGEVWFGVDRQLALHPWDCVTASWRVEGIEKVFFDDNATVGEASSQYCPHSANFAAPTLYIDFQYNFIQRFRIPVMVLTAQWWFWAALAGLLVLGYLSFGPLPGRLESAAPTRNAGLNRRAFLVATGGGALVALIGWGRWTALYVRRPVMADDGWVLDETEVKA